MIQEAVNHIQSAKDIMRRSAQEVGRIEAEHGIDSEAACEKRRRHEQLLDALSTELEDLADLAFELKREYDL